MEQASRQDYQEIVPDNVELSAFAMADVLDWLFFGLSLIWHAFCIAGLLSALVFSFWLPQTSMLSIDKQSEADH